MKTSPITHLLSLFLAATLGMHAAHAAITFTPGHYYSSTDSSRVITQYNPAGNVVGTLTLPTTLGSAVRGLAFGADNLLYATEVRDSGFAVLALNSSGAVQQTYAMDLVYVAGNISYGKVALDSQYLYVAGANQVTRFTLGNPASGVSIYTNNQLFDVEPLPNGNLLAASAYQINEITNAGALVRSIPLVGNSYTDIRGVEFDPITNNLFVTHLGHTGFSFQLMRVDGTTGVLEESVTFNYADDLFLTNSGSLLVGSRTQTPRIYTEDLDQTGALGANSQLFVTQYIPEPGTVSCLFAGGVALLARRNRR